MKLWGGRFQKETNQMVDDFHSSISFDKRLFAQDIKGSIAHAKMLCRQGIIFFAAITVLSSWMGFEGILLAQPAADLLTGIPAFIIISGILRKTGMYSRERRETRKTGM